MKKLLSLVTCLALVGCASVRTVQTETMPDGTERRTEFRARTFFDAHNNLTKARTTMTDKTQGVAISGLEQETSGSNATALAGIIVEAAVKAAVKSVVPLP